MIEAQSMIINIITDDITIRTADGYASVTNDVQIFDKY